MLLFSTKAQKGINQVNGTADYTNSNTGVDNMAAMASQESFLDATPEQKVVRKAYELAPEWNISKIAKRKFMSLPAAFQNGAGKEACVKEALASHKDLIPDPTRYWIWLVDETRKLIRVWDFVETCEDAGVDPQTVAQHLIIEGKMVCNAIRLEGLAAYGSNIRMFVEPLFQDEFKLFSKKANVQDAAAGVKEEGADA